MDIWTIIKSIFTNKKRHFSSNFLKWIFNSKVQMISTLQINVFHILFYLNLYINKIISIDYFRLASGLGSTRFIGVIIRSGFESSDFSNFTCISVTLNFNSDRTYAKNVLKLGAPFSLIHFWTRGMSCLGMSNLYFDSKKLYHLVWSWFKNVFNWIEGLCSVVSRGKSGKVRIFSS